MDRSQQKQATREASLRRLEQEKRLLESYISGQRLDFAQLPVLEPHVRDTFLTWLSKALERKDWRAKTEDGRYYRVMEETPGATCVLD